MVVALVACVVALFVATRGDGGYQVTAEFTTASQLVKGNLVAIGGVSAGKVDRIQLGPQGQALVTFSVNEEHTPLHRGTTATVRSTSLSSIAGRQIQLVPPPDAIAGEEIPDGGTLAEAETVSTVDIDQIFNTLDEETVRDFKRVIQGFERSYEGVAPQANRGLKYLNPLLSSARRLFDELSTDDRALQQLLVDGARFSGALAERSTDVTGLIGNLNRMMNAIGNRKAELSRSVALLPGFMRNANTTFVNLRATLDDVDPLVTASKPAVAELGPFLDELRVASADAVPTVSDLSAIIERPGKNNDLIELNRAQVPLAKVAVGTGKPDCGAGPENPADLQVVADDDYTQGSFGESACSLTNGEASLEFLRAYTPELVGWFDGFSHSGYADALTGMARVSTTFNTFSPSAPVPNLLELDTATEQFSALSLDNRSRCPGANERPLAGDPSVPFTDDGHLTDGLLGDCDPTQVQPGQ